MPTTLYHNPRCSKSRDTLKLLHEHGIQPQIVEYLKAPLNVAMLQNIQSALGCAFIVMIRTQEPLFKDLKLENAAEDDLRCAVVDNPALLQRPILVKDDRAAIGRPPENVLSIL